MAWNISKLLGTDEALKTGLKSLGTGVGNLMDRAGWVKQMSEAEKIDKSIELIKATTDSDKLDADDLKSAREMGIAQMTLQKASWLVRQLNGTLRPVAGWFALISITNKIWGQMLTAFIPGFVWEPITFDPMEALCLSGILAFFFGFRQRSKEKMVNMNG